jgi:hypothetical protein
MDLRGLRMEHLGSLHELRVLTRARRVHRIVVLFDESTDRHAAREAVGAHGDRFIWHDVAQSSDGVSDSILGRLLEGAPGVR